MVKYNCNVCDYETTDSSNFKKHNASKKHVMKTEIYNKTIKIYCSNCGVEFKHKSSLCRHRKICVVQPIIHREKETDIEVDVLKYQMKIKDLELQLVKQKLESALVKSQDEQDKCQTIANIYKDKYETVANIYKDENEFHKTLSVNAGNVLGKTVNALTFIMEKYNKAPELQLLDNETAKKLLTYETKDGKITNLITGKTPLQHLLDLHENNKLVQHLGNLIISRYKKPDPLDQSLWNTDASRLTYAVRNVAIDKERNKKNFIWDSDKRGIKINNYIISPLLTQLRDMIINYDRDIHNKFDDMSQSQRDKYADNSIHTIDIKQGISTSSLHKSILRYITPYFHMSKQSQK
jgi:hypothetical protein